MRLVGDIRPWHAPLVVAGKFQRSTFDQSIPHRCCGGAQCDTPSKQSASHIDLPFPKRASSVMRLHMASVQTFHTPDSDVESGVSRKGRRKGREGERKRGGAGGGARRPCLSWQPAGEPRSPAAAGGVRPLRLAMAHRRLAAQPPAHMADSKAVKESSPQDMRAQRPKSACRRCGDSPAHCPPRHSMLSSSCPQWLAGQLQRKCGPSKWGHCQKKKLSARGKLGTKDGHRGLPRHRTVSSGSRVEK